MNMKSLLSKASLLTILGLVVGFFVIRLTLPIFAAETYIQTVEISSDVGASFKTRTIDEDANIYAIANGGSSFDVAPGESGGEYGSGGNVLVKYSSQGAYLWSVLLPATSSTYDKIDTDSNGNIYILYGSGEIMKFDSAGSLLWTKTFTGSGSLIPRFFVVDSSDNLIIVGIYSVDMDLNPGAGTETIVPVGGSDIFMSKLDNSGNYLWGATWGTTVNDSEGDVAVNSDDDIYFVMDFTGPVDMDPTAGTDIYTNANGQDFSPVVKLDSSGAYLWGNGIGGNGNSSWASAYGIGVDSAGSVIVSGSYGTNIDLDAYSTGLEYTSTNGSVYLVSFDTDGNYSWSSSTQADGAGAYHDAWSEQAIAMRSDDFFYVQGYIDVGTVDFDPTAGVDNLTSVNTGVWISKYSSAGEYLWTEVIGDGADSAVVDYGVATGGGITAITSRTNGTVDYGLFGSVDSISSPAIHLGRITLFTDPLPVPPVVPPAEDPEVTPVVLDLDSVGLVAYVGDYNYYFLTTSLTFTGTSTPTATVAIKVDGTQVAATTVDSGGDWSKGGVVFETGSYEVDVVSTLGSESSTTSLTVHVDSTMATFPTSIIALLTDPSSPETEAVVVDDSGEVVVEEEEITVDTEEVVTDEEEIANEDETSDVGSTVGEAEEEEAKSFNYWYLILPVVLFGGLMVLFVKPQ